ncbi:fungal chitosanase of glycosyl hydrolase group 75-domain-containing protein [Biscogniauxia marginata]|nr:fungal chitosanase of glycosyl hydrolase group 75-domain-containing protein [Biscogniauxia marginata]
MYGERGCGVLQLAGLKRGYSNNAGLAFAYCGDHRLDYRIIYIQGMQKHLADMDIICKGVHGGPADDGRCYSPDTPLPTSFRDTVQSYNHSVADLSPYVHPYVVFGNSGSTRYFDPQEFGIEPLSVMAVVCGDKLIYGIWGDQRDDSGDQAFIGEASLSLAMACYGDSMNIYNGHSDTDVLYIGFNGSDALPGPDGAKWGATSFEEFETSIEGIGDKLIERISPRSP